MLARTLLVLHLIFMFMALLALVLELTFISLCLMYLLFSLFVLSFSLGRVFSVVQTLWYNPMMEFYLLSHCIDPQAGRL